jgi:hypothetical protein
MTTRGRTQADLDGPETPIAFGSLTAADVATDSNMPQAGNNAPRPSDRPELGNAARNQDETDIEALVNRFDALLALEANSNTFLEAKRRPRNARKAQCGTWSGRTSRQ